MILEVPLKARKSSFPWNGLFRLNLRLKLASMSRFERKKQDRESGIGLLMYFQEWDQRKIAPAISPGNQSLLR
ncbi:hypothetical protein BST99_13340 [Aureicoccus marinus]|uniref:Uncharacterized protein n=1 Tax=Aureicoccus marinus TaxID=754435 RepID=A0A2S7T9G0_9FLAO|nr:hypothetical protein BST99_13340 [Aureicoccus marinus]